MTTDDVRGSVRGEDVADAVLCTAALFDCNAVFVEPFGAGETVSVCPYNPDTGTLYGLTLITSREAVLASGVTAYCDPGADVGRSE